MCRMRKLASGIQIHCYRGSNLKKYCWESMRIATIYKKIQLDSSRRATVTATNLFPPSVNSLRTLENGAGLSAPHPAPGPERASQIQKL